jgi:hypothetical protein
MPPLENWKKQNDTLWTHKDKPINLEILRVTDPGLEENWRFAVNRFTNGNNQLITNRYYDNKESTRRNAVSWMRHHPLEEGEDVIKAYKEP